MNNTSFSRIRNVDNITDMGYSLNRVSPIFGEQGQTPAQSTKPRNPKINTKTKKRDILINILFHRVLIHDRKVRHHRMTPTNQWRTICEVKAAGSDSKTQGTQHPTTNQKYD